jgi:hypothetical protein
MLLNCEFSQFSEEKLKRLRLFLKRSATGGGGKGYNPFMKRKTEVFESKPSILE